ncbi:MAG TPA: hypothetical protein VG496_07450 [Myxococcales bacterium]|nr:hypothetical protein [Myxococcales bacterium]
MNESRPARAIAIAAPFVWDASALVWPALCLCGAIGAIAPLWVGRFLPFQDAPQHLAAIRVLAEYHSPRFAFEKWFEIDLLRSQYLGFYLPAAGLSRLFGPEAACRLVLSVIALAIPAASWMFLRSLGRDVRLAVFSPALFHTAPLYLGFFNFVASIPATIFVLALVERELRAPRVGRAALLAIAAVALLYLHPSALALAIGASAVLGVSAGAGVRRVVRALAPFIAALALLGAWMAHALFGQSAATVGSKLPRWEPVRERFLDFLRLGNVLAGHADEVFVAALFALWVLAALVPGRPTQARWWRLPLLVALIGVVYFAVPESFGAAGSMHLRALPLLAALLLATPLLAPGRLTSALLVSAVVVQLAYDAKLSSAYRAFEVEAEAPQLEELLRQAEPGKRLLSLVHQRESRVVQFQAYQHFGMYYQVERGGRARRNFAELPWTPVRFRKGTEVVSLPPGFEEHPEWFNPQRDGADEDYLLVRAGSSEPGAPFVVKAHAGRWTLYRAVR